ncbi:hypothetical protein B9Z51_06820 [Limnohabitans sp. T6-5]|uniref:hypothetical protein n=1 Tax=Limnohabitans sp. T6-5 TaxID=1100724 RepID=UPI000D34C872|nr:hypothetical protein [Limnohabitans sp. T6-5]PUE08657.1 hypothetical protein B9Z51_06820 [Limnohabitans sp. T6-5]
MELLQYLYIHALIIFSIPIVLGFVLRKIAGKHAPAFYEPETEAEKIARHSKAKRDAEDHHRIWWCD